VARGFAVAVASRENQAGRAELRVRSGWNRGGDRSGADLGRIASNSERSSRSSKSKCAVSMSLALGIGKERMSVHATRIAAGSASVRVHTATCSRVASWLVFNLLQDFERSRHSTHARLSSGGSKGVQTL
jgi:hypothetical protein